MDKTAETTLLGLLLKFPEATMADASSITPQMFSENVCRATWGVLTRRIEAGQPTSIRTLKREEKSLKGYIDELRAIHGDAPPTSAHVAHHVGQMLQHVQYRQLLEISAMIDNESLIENPISLSEQIISKLMDGATEADSGAKKWKKMKEVMLTTVDEIEKIHAHGGKLLGQPTGLTRLSEMTSGLQKGKVYVIAGRPGKGKTALGLQIARAATDEDNPSAFFSLEMPDTELGQRLLASETNGVSPVGMSKQDLIAVMQAAQSLANINMFVRDFPLLNKTALRMEVRKLAKKNVRTVVLDYVQLCQTAGGSDQRRVEFGEITKICKQLSKTFGMSFILLSQFNREAEAKEELHIGMLSDSDEIGRDADCVIGITHSQHLHVMKNRGGPTGILPHEYIGPQYRFSEISHEEAQRRIEEQEEEQPTSKYGC